MLLKSLFIDKHNNRSIVTIEFDVDGVLNSRPLYYALDVNTANLAVFYAAGELADETIAHQDPITVQVIEPSLDEQYESWLDYGRTLIIEFNALSSGLDSTVSGMV